METENLIEKIKREGGQYEAHMPYVNMRGLVPPYQAETYLEGIDAHLWFGAAKVIREVTTGEREFVIRSRFWTMTDHQTKKESRLLRVDFIPVKEASKL
jgi:hypothetical protein